MYIKLFTTQGNIAVPTESCYIISWLKDIIDAYPENHVKIFAYLQFMFSWNPDDNPYLAIKEEDREQTIISDIKADFSTEDDLIQIAIKNCKKLFELPAYRTWKSIKGALKNIEDFCATQKISTGKDGSGPFIMSAAEKLPALNRSFNEAYKTYMEEAKLEVRGGRFNSLT